MKPQTPTNTTAKQLKKLQQIADEAPRKQPRNKTRDTIQQITPQLTTMINKGYNRDEIANMLQMADITGISKTALKKAITEIRKQTTKASTQTDKRPNHETATKQTTNPTPKPIREIAQRQPQRIKLRTEQEQAQNTAPRPF